MKKAFTLLETLIVVVIVGTLAVVLTQSYLTISKLAFKVEQEKNLTEEALLLTQTLQSLADTATIDFDAYRDGGSNLINEKGFTDTLYLTGALRSGASLSSTEECSIDLEGSFGENEEGVYDPTQVITNNSWCQLILKQGEIEIPLIATNKVIHSKVGFKVIPFASEQYYFSDTTSEENILNKIQQPAFWIFIHLYSPYYQPTGMNKVDRPLQLFFNLNAPTPSLFWQD